MDSVRGALGGQQGSTSLHINQCVVKYDLACLINITGHRAIGHNSPAALLWASLIMDVQLIDRSTAAHLNSPWLKGVTKTGVVSINTPPAVKYVERVAVLSVGSTPNSGTCKHTGYTQSQ